MHLYSTIHTFINVVYPERGGEARVVEVEVLGIPRVPKLPQVGEPLFWGSHYGWLTQLSMTHTDRTRPHQHHQNHPQPSCHLRNVSLEVKVIVVLVAPFHI